MQQTNSYWRVLGVAGVVGALVASACVVTTSTDDSAAGSAGTGLVTSSGGNGGTSTGTGGATGGASSVSAGGNSLGIAGNAAAGGGSVAFACDPDGGAVLGTPSSCVPDSDSSCSTCVKSHCCTEYSNCYATNPGDQCGWGGPKGEGEISCFQACVIDSTSDGGVVDSDLLGTCAGQCGTPRDSAGMSCQDTIGQQTSDLIACLNADCSSECFGG
jgi:hypothetical protein